MQLTHRFIISLTVAAAISAAASLVDPVEKDSKGVAVKGYDVVAYFTDSRPVKGSPNFAQNWNGATWWFANADHRDQFRAAPQKFAPEYGGYCAYGVSQGHAVPIDPEAWKIIDGKLYLNYSKSVQKKWSEAIPKHIDEANRNWPTLHK